MQIRIKYHADITKLNKKQPDFEFVEVEDLGNPNRGGIGATG